MANVNADSFQASASAFVTPLEMPLLDIVWPSVYTVTHGNFYYMMYAPSMYRLLSPSMEKAGVNSGTSQTSSLDV